MSHSTPYSSPPPPPPPPPPHPLLLHHIICWIYCAPLTNCQRAIPPPHSCKCLLIKAQVWLWERYEVFPILLSWCHLSYSRASQTKGNSIKLNGHQWTMRFISNKLRYSRGPVINHISCCTTTSSPGTFGDITATSLLVLNGVVKTK